MQVAFKTSLDLLPPDEETPESTADPSDQSSTEGRKLEFQDELIIQFNNSTTQVIKVSSCFLLTTVQYSIVLNPQYTKTIKVLKVLLGVERKHV